MTNKEGTMERHAQEIGEGGLANGAELRTLADVRDCATERRDHEYRNRPAPELTNTVGGGMSLGAVETLDALLAYLNGDDDA